MSPISSGAYNPAKLFFQDLNPWDKGVKKIEEMLESFAYANKQVSNDVMFVYYS